MDEDDVPDDCWSSTTILPATAFAAAPIVAAVGWVRPRLAAPAAIAGGSP